MGIRSCVSAAQLQLAVFYLFMVILNGVAVALFDRGATDGYAFSYVQPDGRTFGIWGIIYTLLIALVFRADALYPEVRTFVCTAFTLNGLWLITNGLAVNEGWSYWSAVFVLWLYAAFLWRAYHASNVDYKEATVSQLLTVYAPLSLNLAWVTLAAILNFSNTAMNDKLDFTKKENRTAVGGPDWSMGVFLLAALLASYLSIIKGDFVYALGTVWALQGVQRQQTKDSGFPHPISARVHDWAHALSIAVGVMAAVGFIRVLVTKPYRARRAAKQEEEGLDEAAEAGSSSPASELQASFMPLQDKSTM